MRCFLFSPPPFHEYCSRPSSSSFFLFFFLGKGVEPRRWLLFFNPDTNWRWFFSFSPRALLFVFPFSLDSFDIFSSRLQRVFSLFPFPAARTSSPRHVGWPLFDLVHREPQSLPSPDEDARYVQRVFSSPASQTPRRGFRVLHRAVNPGAWPSLFFSLRGADIAVQPPCAFFFRIRGTDRWRPGFEPPSFFAAECQRRGSVFLPSPGFRPYKACDVDVFFFFFFPLPTVSIEPPFSQFE